jgi:AcrR family transcriptional regulator
MPTAAFILEKAFELIRKYGIRSVTMDDVAGQCGISKKTLYQHFADKDTLIFTVMQNMIAHSESQCEKFCAQSENAVHEIFLSLDMLQEMFEGVNPVMLYDLHKYHQEAYKKLENHKNRFLYDVTYKNLQRGISEGLFRSDLNLEIVTVLHLYTISLTFEQELIPPNKFSLLEVQMEIMLHYVHGIVTQRGAKLIERYKQQRLNRIAV